MCFLELKPLLSFSYRNTNCISAFDANSSFAFIISNTSIYQYCRGDPLPLVCNLGFVPIFSRVFMDRYLLASRTELFYFKYAHHRLGPMDPLAQVFAYKNRLVTVGDSYRIYKFDDGNDSLRMEPSKNKETNETHGLCSAHCVINDEIFLGFEDGFVGKIDGTDLIDQSVRTLILKKMALVKDPVLSICVDGSCMFVHTLSYIFRIGEKRKGDLKENDNDNFFTEIKARKMILISKSLILVQKKRLVFLDLRLKIRKTFLCLFEIKDVKIVDDSLMVGCSNGLLCEYDLMGVVRMVESGYCNVYRTDTY